MIALKDKPGTYDCIFLNEDKKCSIYDVRPKQCVKYPFWDSIINSEENWNEEAESCEGIKIRKPPNISAEQIKEICK